MSDQTPLEVTGASAENETVDELAVLKSRARMLGVEFSNNIGLETLRERIRAKMESDESKNQPAPAMTTTPEEAAKPKKTTLREQLMAEAMKLVRVRITNLDPKKRDRPGEIFTVANEFIGTIRKYVPYGEVTENGYHLPNCIYQNLKERKFLNIRSIKGKNGQIRIEQTWAPEFAFEVLPQLTPEELAKLAAAQAAANGVGGSGEL